MTKKLQKGFTLIELLIVIAIIGILSSVVLGSLNTARSKAADAAIKGDLNSIRSQASIFYDNQPSPSYGTAQTAACNLGAGNIFADPNVKNSIAHAVIQNGGTDGYCGTTGQGYAVAVPLKTAGIWCVDSNGVSRSTTAGGVDYVTITDAITAGASVCN